MALIAGRTPKATNMPLYEFQCRVCGRSYEELIRNAADEQATACPECGSKEVARLLSAPASCGSESLGGSGGCAPRGGFT